MPHRPWSCSGGARTAPSRARRCAAAALLGLSFWPAAPAGSDPGPREISWYRMDLPPIYIAAGPYKDLERQRASDVAIQRALESRGYHISFRQANLERLTHALDSEPYACATALLWSAEREKALALSIPHSMGLPSYVVARKNQLARFQPFLDADGRVSLDALLEHSDLVLGIAAGRTHIGVIDEILARHAENRNIFRRPGEDILSGLMQMLARGRIDYTLISPWEANYYSRTAAGDAPPEEIASMPVQGMPDYGMMVGACHRSAWGLRVVEIMNEAIRAVRDTPEYEASKEYWLDEHAKQIYRRHLKAYRADAARLEERR